MELLRIYIDIQKTVELKTGDSLIRLVLFGGFCNSPIFKGKIMEGGTDTQIIRDVTYLSARYMLEGEDAVGNKCRLFIENNGVDRGTMIKSEPVIYTDSPALKWLETARLRGRVITENDMPVVVIYEGCARECSDNERGMHRA